MRITSGLLEDWEVCGDGLYWFIERFPEGADYKDVITALRKEQHNEWVLWLNNKMFALLFQEPVQISDFVKNEVNQAIDDAMKLMATSGDCSTLASSGYGSKLASSGYGSTLAASGDCSKLAASGDCSTLASSGHSSRLASSGHSSRLASSGNNSKLASSGYDSILAASGNNSKLASSGYGSILAASGYGSVVMAAGVDCRASAGLNGAFALAWKDGDQVRIAVGIVGENGIKANTMYRVGDNGVLEEVAS